MSILSRLIPEGAATRRAREIASLPEGDLAAWGVSRAELSGLARMPHEQIVRMERMAHVFGADSLRPEQQAEIARACAGCFAHGQCRGALAEEAGPERMGFCPNATTFRQIAEG
ncbi:DUF6455 family protein [Pseudoroseicyclus tamaricis]|uniref:DUF6455 domain-containing protein n=1 Tax=Pseudoroseicyclus tamaricis TaxID=2705421 RepID=A0A6B2JPN7_9RHOB|nr:DUF6455 family protein [Pseudoroseicyclus tamaricis]NDU99969.1 hypothetical protein [Pseudoroseicyclus tamaricis]